MALDEADKQWIIERLGMLERSLDERVEVMETKLLTAFHGWASPVEVKSRSHSAALRALVVQVESLEDRVKKLEESFGR
jgi:chaperonin cofactor prefoldin